MRRPFARMADRPTLVLSTSLAFVLVTATACANEPERVEDAPAQPPAPPLYSTVWSAEAGADLFGRPAELIRATSEAVDFWAYEGSGASYPGYVDALNTSRDWSNPRIDAVFLSASGFQQHAATSYKHLVELEHDAQSVAATVCDYIVFPVAGAKHPASPLRRAVRIELANSTVDAGAPGQVDHDPVTASSTTTRTPSWNVFGDWSIEEISYIDDEDLPEACVDWCQERFPEFIRKPGGNVLFPPPGYVYPAVPVAAQYPEWIPASDDNSFTPPPRFLPTDGAE